MAEIELIDIPTSLKPMPHSASTLQPLSTNELATGSENDAGHNSDFEFGSCNNTVAITSKIMTSPSAARIEAANSGADEPLCQPCGKLAFETEELVKCQRLSDVHCAICTRYMLDSLAMARLIVIEGQEGACGDCRLALVDGSEKVTRCAACNGLQVKL
ncbi:hypothetical protein LTR78_002880 [Recurvomyces mirabilis]|uniref:Uncharacterized protein n=1 Tax=Recurvomyces mirabilis TaxID=574656 RepID=A0AAE0WT69_9PEZI|nr:hypothetical protein LTR78_002880 [Recurvomyces mirabilis]KAK5159386.1 hypothetical protein LTS14_002528 [Recurvomyces mirabilis]